MPHLSCVACLLRCLLHFLSREGFSRPFRPVPKWNSRFERQLWWSWCIGSKASPKLTIAAKLEAYATFESSACSGGCRAIAMCIFDRSSNAPAT